MISSGLRDMRPRHTVTVISKSLSGGYSESNLYTGLIATHEQRDAFELMTETGAVVMVTDVFWFEPMSTGSLPAITEAHVLSTGGKRYEAMQVTNQGGGNNRLRVMTRRVR